MQNVPKITSYQKGSCDDKVFQKSVCEEVTNNKTLRKLFVKYSNAVPSIAAVKGLFSLGKEELKPGMWKRLFFKRFRFHTYRFRFHFHRFRFHQQKTKKRPLTIFFNFCGSVACLLLHFIILRKPKPSFIAITLPTSLKLIVSNYSVFLFLRYQNSR